jgi:hypothetical protein
VSRADVRRGETTMTRVWTITALGSLGLACAQGEGLWSREGQELQTEYQDRQQGADQCLETFGVCVAEAVDDDGVSACADELQLCLAVGLLDEDENDNENADENEDDGMPGETEGLPGETDGDVPEDTDTDGEDENDDDDDPLGAECQPILDLCLEDPGNFDPFCLADFEECIQISVAFELQELCNEIEAKCLELEIPNFDCFDVCG